MYLHGAAKKLPRAALTAGPPLNLELYKGEIIVLQCDRRIRN